MVSLIELGAGLMRVGGFLTLCVVSQILCSVQGCQRLFFFLFRAAPAAYGSSQARGRIRATAANHSHSITGSKLHLQPAPQLIAMLDP